MATITQTQLEIKLQPPSTSRFIHPRLTVGFSPSAGRMVASTGSVKAGDVLMIDQPYALVPAMAPDQPLFAICSSHTCNRRIPSESEMVYCAHGCVEEVAWCNEECRLRDERFHAAECSWLREMAGGMRAEYDDADFGVIWLIARCLIRKQLEYDGKQVANHVSHFDRRGWNAVWNLDGPIPSAKEKHWETIFDKYFTAMAKGLAGSVKEAMDLLWKVENNSFGLYPGTTGEYPVASFVSRGEYYGGGVWPTAAMFNHSCCPNVRNTSECFSSLLKAVAK